MQMCDIIENTMDENNTYIELITAQLKTLQEQAQVVLGTAHPVFKALEVCNDELSLLRYAEERINIPAGFESAEAYQAFLSDMEPVLIKEDGELVASETIGDVVGTIITPAGEVTEVGNIELSAAQAQEVVDSLQETMAFEETLEAENTIRITYTRLDEATLTTENVQTILDSRISEPLKHLGNLQLIEIIDGETDAEKVAVLGVVAEGVLNMTALAIGVAQYRGVAPIPGLGMVKAVGEVKLQD